jgi:hypothetical protein
MFVIPGGSASTIIQPEYVGYSSNIVAGTSHTFTSVAFGAAFTTRRLFVSIFIRKSGAGDIAPSSVTIGGVSATIEDLAVGYSTWNCCGAYADIPTGTSGTIVVNWPSTVDAVMLSVIALDTRMNITYATWNITSYDTWATNVYNANYAPGYMIMTAMATSNTTSGTVTNGGGLGTSIELLETSVAGAYPMTLLVGRNPIYAEEYANIGYSFTGDQGTANIAMFIH